VGAWTWDAGTDALTWSDELYRIHGLEAGTALTQRRVLELIVPADRDRVEEAARAAIEAREPFDLTYRISRPDGTSRDLEVSGAVQVDDAGRVSGLAGMALDVTDRLAAEEALAAARIARRQATELNDNVVQGLVLAKYALGRDDDASAARMIDDTLGHARRMITDLIGRDAVRPGDLRREEPARVDRS
jgi:PAS domain S-box-containing protein